MESVVEVRECGKAGRGLFTLKDVEAGAVLLQETPVAAMQHPENAMELRACANCLSLLSQPLLHAIAERVGLGSAMSLPKTLVDTLQDIHVGVASDSKEVESQDVLCSGDCGEAYCSEECRRAAWERHHSSVCPGSGDEEEKDFQIKFADQAMRKNDQFMMAASIVSELKNKYLSGGEKELETAVNWWRENFCHRNWWLARTPLPKESFEEMESELKEALSESYAFLREGILPSDEIFWKYVSEEFYSFILGTFELNNITIEFSSDVETELNKLKTSGVLCPEDSKALTEVEDLARKMSLLEEFGGDEDDDENEDVNEDVEDRDEEEMEGPEGEESADIDLSAALDERLKAIESSDKDVSTWPGFEGVGLYVIASKINHSCIPNVKFEYDRKNSLLSVVARESIPAGSQLFHSYIDRNLSLLERQKELLGYGFICQCPKCFEEQQTERVDVLEELKSEFGADSISIRLDV